MCSGTWSSACSGRWSNFPFFGSSFGFELVLLLALVSDPALLSSSLTTVKGFTLLVEAASVVVPTSVVDFFS